MIRILLAVWLAWQSASPEVLRHLQAGTEADKQRPRFRRDTHDTAPSTRDRSQHGEERKHVECRSHDEQRDLSQDMSEVKVRTHDHRGHGR